MASDAPIYPIPPRRVVAVEHPMILRNIDRGIQTFRNVPLHEILETDDAEGSLPLYLRTDPAAAPILSQNMPCSNLVLMVTVPKRTGRKRKRGSTEPFTGVAEPFNVGLPILRSHSRLDDPRALQRSMSDNPQSYQVEVVGSMEQTHRYRGLSDFHFSTTHGRFMTQFREKLLPLDLDQMKEFKFDPSRGPKVDDEILPPPRLTDQPLPFNWGYHQNPAIKLRADHQTGLPELINQYAPVKVLTKRLDCEDPLPPAPSAAPPDEPILLNLIAELRRVLDERPIWTRRGITNRIKDFPGIYLIKTALQYVSYQFRGGPWRDALIKFGVDPRTDPKYRVYQTLFFKLFQNQDRMPGAAWEDPRSEYTRQLNKPSDSKDSHIFDGKSVTLDGKVWQVCDITDPLLQRLLATDLLRTDCDTASDGWYCNGTWAKVKAVMRAKLNAIEAGVTMTDEHFEEILKTPDVIPDKAKVILNPPPLPGTAAPPHKRRPHMDALGKTPTLRGKPAKRNAMRRTRGARAVRIASASHDSPASVPSGEEMDIPIDPNLADYSDVDDNIATPQEEAVQGLDDHIDQTEADTATEYSGSPSDADEAAG